LVELSQQTFMDCSWSKGNQACDGGLDFQAYEWALETSNGSIPEAKSYGGYQNADGKCHFTNPHVRAGAAITGYVNVTGGVEALNKALVTVGPVSVSIDASPDSLYYYQGGYYQNSECKSGLSDLDHTVLAVGYVTYRGQKYWIVKNSWSTHWGDNGYIFISQLNNTCGVATQPTYVKM